MYMYAVFSMREYVVDLGMIFFWSTNVLHTLCCNRKKGAGWHEGIWWDAWYTHVVACLRDIHVVGESRAVMHVAHQDMP